MTVYFWYNGLTTYRGVESLTEEGRQSESEKTEEVKKITSYRPETRWANDDQAEVEIKGNGGPN